MRQSIMKYRWLHCLLLVGVLCCAACSTQQTQPKDDMAVNAADPFDDPFFTQVPAWDDAVLQQSEVLTEKEEEPRKPKTLLEQSEGVMLSTLMVGFSVAQMAIPFLF